MNPSLPIINIARITLEAETPISIGSGEAQGLFDMPLVRDYNDLPAIPGSSLAGVLRQLHLLATTEACNNQLFGYQNTNDDSQSSRLTVSWAHIHDRNNAPVTALQGKIDDPLLHPLIKQLPFRDRVAINHKGTAKDNGKFDQSYVHAGHRFTFELQLQQNDNNAATDEWQTLLSLLNSPGFRLGRATRSGFGKVAISDCHSTTLDLRNAQQLQHFSQLSKDLGNRDGLKKHNIVSNSDNWTTLTLKLTPEHGWRFGGGKQSLLQLDKSPDDLSVTENHVYWEKGKARYSKKQVLIPASGIKGPLAHRCGYHYLRLTQQWANAEIVSDYDASKTNNAVREIFGFALGNQAKNKDNPDALDNDAQAGLLTFNDSYLKPDTLKAKVGQQMHNSIDRFTGGVRDKVLFSEELIYQTGFDVQINIDNKRWGTIDDPIIKAAIKAALDDLLQGRLALGAGGAKGHGYFTGELTTSEEIFA